MKQRLLLLSSGLATVMVLLLMFGTAAGQTKVRPNSDPRTPTVISGTLWADLPPGRETNDGVLREYNQSIFGYNSCAPYGDPFSPGLDPLAANFRQQWRDSGADRTYHYRILIPAGYNHDIVRVELFDPDSINQPNNNGNNFSATVLHTTIAQQAGMPPSETRSCTGTQINPCLINTGEFTAVRPGYPNLTPSELLLLLNYFWFARIDENRGNGPAPGNGTCGSFSTYDPTYNTITQYELFYWQETPTGLVRTDLASYYGQAGDFVYSRNGYLRDLAFSSFNHQTDLRWVSPGGIQANDQPAVVPTACGSPNGGDYDPVNCPAGSPPSSGNGFEIDLTSDLPNIFTDTDGNRYLYLDVTAQSGASENGFQIWAGPSDYVSGANGSPILPSEVNARNVAMINAPGSHSADGVMVYAIGSLPLNSNFGANWDGIAGNDFIDIPLTTLGPEYASQSIYVSIYDTDSGAAPPLIFYFDTIPFNDWSLTFSQPPLPDPDGGSGRCLIGLCTTQFVVPPYRLDIPATFTGGQLIARYISGTSDTYHWHIRLPAVALAPSANLAEGQGDGNGYETNPTNAYADDGQMAIDLNSGTGSSTNCANPKKDAHRFYGFDLSRPAGHILTGIELQLDALADSPAGAPKLCLQLSWDGGLSWTTFKTTPTLTTSETRYTLGGNGDLWGHNWTTSEIANLQLRIVNVAGNTGRDFSLDWLGITLFSQPQPTNTGPIPPTSNNAGSSGDGNGFETNPANAYLSDNLYAIDTNSGTTNSNSCTNSGKDSHLFYGFDFGLPAGAVVTGLEVQLEAKVDGLARYQQMCVQLSWDGGLNWTTLKTTPSLTTSDALYLLGGTNDTWNRLWNLADFDPANFRLRLINVSDSSGRDFSLDALTVQLYYQ